MPTTVVTSLPLAELHTAHGPAVLSGDLTEANIRALLREQPIQFLIADVGKPLQWISQAECFSFWKTEVKHHLAAGSSVLLEDFPGGYCYFASRWHVNDTVIVLLSKCH